MSNRADRIRIAIVRAFQLMQQPRCPGIAILELHFWKDLMATKTETIESGSAHVTVGIILALTILVSAYLLFQVQPLISKFILPWFGGSPAVWTTAMLFFQCLLFFGYSYAHLVSRFLSIRQQTLIHIALVIFAAYLAAFIVPGEHFKPTGGKPDLANFVTAW